MAARKDTDRVLAGSLNLLPPADLQPQGDSPFLENWRVDLAGQLRSRAGFTSKATGKGNVHTLFRAGQDRYCGGGDTLYHGEAAAGTVDTGFDGSRLGMVRLRDRTYVMNRSKRVAVDGAVSRGWGIAAPGACTAAPGAQPSQPVVEFDNTEGWLVYRLDDAGEVSLTPVYEPTDKKSGTHSLYVECNPGGKRYYVSQTFGTPKDMRVGGEARANDLIRIWIKAADRERVDAIYLSMWSGTDNAASVTCQIPIQVLAPATQTWTLVEIRRGLTEEVTSNNVEYQRILRDITAARADADPTREQELVQARDALQAQILARNPYFTDVSAAGETFDWGAVKTITFDVIVNEATDVLLDAIDVVGGPEGSLEGKYTWYVSYENDDGEEGSLSPASNEVELKKQKASLTAIPVSSDPQVTIKNIYRGGGSLGEPLYVATITNATTSYTDDVPNETLRRVARKAYVDNDPPPPARGCCYHAGRIVAWSTAAHPARVWWSKIAEYHAFPYALDEGEGFWQDVGDTKEEILWCTSSRGRLYVYKQRSIWVYPGDPDDVDPELVVLSIGPVGASAVCECGSVDALVTSEGVHIFSGDWPRKISQKVEPIFNRMHVEVGGVVTPPINKEKLHLCALGYRDGELWFSYPEDGQSANNRTLIYDLETERWRVWRAGAFGGFSAFFNEGSFADYSGFLLGGTPGGRMVELDAGLTDGGAAIPLLWQSRWLDQGLPDIPKRWTEITIEARTGLTGQTPSTITFSWVGEDGTVTVLGNVAAAVEIRQRFTVDRRGYRGALRVTGDVTTDVIVTGLYLHWYPEVRDGQFFDSGPVSWPLEHECAEIRMEVTTGAALTVYIQTDDGGVLALSETRTVTHTAGRRQAFVRPSSIWRGRIMRVYVTSTQPFQMHRLWLSVRENGESIQPGQIWDPAPVEIGA